MRVWVEHAVAVAGHTAVIDTPSCGRHRAAVPVAVNRRGRMLASNVSNLALELNEMNGLVTKDIVVYDQTDLGRELLQEEAIGLRRHRTGERIHGLPVSWGCRVDLRGTDLAVLDHLTDGFLPSSAGGVVMPDGVWVAEKPGVEMAHLAEEFEIAGGKQNRRILKGKSKLRRKRRVLSLQICNCKWES